MNPAKKKRIEGARYTYREAKAAVSRLGINSQTKYDKIYKKDKGLPAHPDRAYKDKGWVNWFDFLGKKKKAYYPKYAQALAVVKRLRIKSANDYKNDYKKDNKLPSHPDEFYAKKGWKGWQNFLGTKIRTGKK